MRLQSITNFRAIAIILIVAGHSYAFGFTGDDFTSRLIKSFITGNTTLFVFISGYMFNHVFYKRYDYKKFMIDKIKNVGFPYLLLSTIIIFIFFIKGFGYYAAIDSSTDMDIYSPPGIIGKIFSPNDSSFITTVKYYFTGAPITAYWYIPFVMILFALSPFHYKYIKLSAQSQLYIILALTFVSLITHRPEFRNPLINIIYFTPVYLFGILASLYRQQFLGFIKRRLIIILITYIVFIIIQNYIGFSSNTGKDFFEVYGIDMIFINKILLISLLWGALEKYTFNNKIINTISETSFAIFFIHGWVIMVLSKLRKMFFPPAEINLMMSDNNLLLYIFSLIIIISISVFISLITKKLFLGSKKTRYLIGY